MVPCVRDPRRRRGGVLGRRFGNVGTGGEVRVNLLGRSSVLGVLVWGARGRRGVLLEPRRIRRVVVGEVHVGRRGRELRLRCAPRRGVGVLGSAPAGRMHGGADGHGLRGRAVLGLGCVSGVRSGGSVHDGRLGVGSLRRPARADLRGTRRRRHRVLEQLRQRDVSAARGRVHGSRRVAGAIAEVVVRAAPRRPGDMLGSARPGEGPRRAAVGTRGGGVRVVERRHWACVRAARRRRSRLLGFGHLR